MLPTQLAKSFTNWGNNARIRWTNSCQLKSMILRRAWQQKQCSQFIWSKTVSKINLFETRQHVKQPSRCWQLARLITSVGKRERCKKRNVNLCPNSLHANRHAKRSSSFIQSPAQTLACWSELTFMPSACFGWNCKITWKKKNGKRLRRWEGCLMEDRSRHRSRSLSRNKSRSRNRNRNRSQSRNQSLSRN